MRHSIKETDSQALLALVGSRVNTGKARMEFLIWSSKTRNSNTFLLCAAVCVCTCLFIFGPIGRSLSQFGQRTEGEERLLLTMRDEPATAFTFTEHLQSSQERHSHRLSVLRGVTPDDVRMEPFPHLVITNALPTQLYERLSSHFPSDESIYRTSSGLTGPVRWINNYRYSMDTSLLKSQLWKEFINFHTSQAFFAQAAHVFAWGIARFRPDLLLLASESNLTVPELSTATRKSAKSNLLTGVEVVLNSEVRTRGSVRGPHHDKLDEIFAALLYFRRPSDNSIGGSFQVYRCKGNCTKVANIPALKRKLGLFPLGRHEQFDPRTIELMSEVAYRYETA